MTPHRLFRRRRARHLRLMMHASPSAAAMSATLHGRMDRLDARLARVALIARVTDTAISIPGTDVKLGLDAIIGAVPVAGDLLMASASAVLIHDAWKLGVPRAAVTRMAANAVLDATIGSVPFIGDLFDLVYRANERNLRIIETHLGRLDAPRIDH